MIELILISLMAAAAGAAGALLVLIGTQIVALWRLRREAYHAKRIDKIAAHNRAEIIRDLTRGKL